MNDEPLDYECKFCGFKAKTPLEIWVHECDGKRMQKEAIKMGQELQNSVMVSV